jgi:subtilisin family serine protease
VTSDVGNETFEGSPNTAFAGELYDLNSPTSIYFAHDRVKPAATSDAVTQGIYGGSRPGTWEYFNGTSMASPHVSGVAALVASKYPGSSPTAIKSIVMSSGKAAPATTGKTVTGKMADARAALYPRVTATSPAPNATNVARGANTTATFSEAMNATTINTNTFTLVKSGTTTPVGASVTYDVATKKATLNPGVDLAPGATYTATVKGGTSGVKNATPGDPMVANKTWKFTVSP